MPETTHPVYAQDLHIHTTLSRYAPHRHSFRFLISSDAHRPNWLSQSVACAAAWELGIRETPLPR